MSKSKKVSIKNKPTKKPDSLTITRDDLSFEAKWTIPSAMVNEKKNDRATSLTVKWIVNGKKEKTQKGLATNTTSSTLTLSASKYNPSTGKILKSVTCIVYGVNKVGEATKAHRARQSFAINEPKKPTLSEIVFDQESGEASAQVTVPNSDSDHNPVSKTRYTLAFQASYNTVPYALYAYSSSHNAAAEQRLRASFSDATNIVYAGKIDSKRYLYIVYRKKTADPAVKKSGTTTSTTFNTKSYDLQGYKKLKEDQWMRVIFSMEARGYGGDSGWVEKDYYVAVPKKVSITKVSYTGLTGQSRMLIDLKKYSSKEHPIDKMVLERLKSITATSATIAAQEDGWEDVPNAVDDQQCIGFSDAMSDVFSGMSRSTRVWYRVRAERCGLVRYGDPVQCPEAVREVFPSDSAEDNTCAILAVEDLKTGNSLRITLAYCDKAHEDNADGTQLTYSPYDDAWTSNVAPSELSIDWNDSPPSNLLQTTYIKNSQGQTVLASTMYQRTATVILHDLEEGVTLYFKGRRYQEHATRGMTYGVFCEQRAGCPSSSPVSVQIFAEKTFIEGRDFFVSWTYQSSKEQTAWAINKNGQNDIITSSSEGMSATETAAVIPWSQLSKWGDKFNLQVAVRCGGDPTNSPLIEVTKIRKPVVSSVVLITAATNPKPTFRITANRSVRKILCTISAKNGVSRDNPGRKELSLAAGEVIKTYSMLVDSNTVDITVNDCEYLYPGIDYIVEAVAYDTANNLKSDPVALQFRGTWSYTPPVLSNTWVEGRPDYTVIIHINDGTNGLITLANTDKIDIYRITPEGPYLIAENLPPNRMKVVDRFAPYSKYITTRYRIVVKSEGNVLSQYDVGYNIDAMGVMIFNWGDGRSVQLPWNVDISDSYEKDFDARRHMDGGIKGYWNTGVIHKASLNSDVIRIDNSDTIYAIKELAQETGPIFVRTPNGSAYEADVQISNIPDTHNATVMNVSFSATEIDLTDAYVVDRSRDVVTVA